MRDLATFAGYAAGVMKPILTRVAAVV